MNTLERVIFDVFPSDFNEKGYFHLLIHSLKKKDFKELVLFEKKNVTPFLEEWQRQLNEERKKHPLCYFLEPINLFEWFEKTPLLSGVLYLSHNFVVSESLFEGKPTFLKHLTDRELHSEVKKNLPNWKELTFSFPRQYQFEGFYNSWGFVRIEREDSYKNGAGILMSVTTLDGEILSLLKEHQCNHLAILYNEAWSGAIHDYVHHIALYTNPSFGIGKLSPMSLVQENEAIDEWGRNMKDTFNYEYWAHRTHRLITEKTLTEEKKKEIIKTAKNYFKEVLSFLKKLLKKKEVAFVQRVSNYLTYIYLWPLHILLNPLDSLFEELRESINLLYLDTSINVKDKALNLIAEFEEKEKAPYGPRVIALQELIKGLSLKQKIDNQSVDWFDVIRLEVDTIVQRGVYENWFHKEEVLYKNEPIHPHQATLHILKVLEETFFKFQMKTEQISSYKLEGIVP